MKNENIIGQKINKLTILSLRRNDKSNLYAQCLCECGEKKEIRLDKIKIGHTKSCGCLNAKRSYTGTHEHNTWKRIRTRCKGCDPHHKKYYLDKGIIICDRWDKSFSDFLCDMGYAPSDKHSIDRIDFKGNYDPSNCRWATKAEQSRNTSANVRITYNGRTQIIKDWCRELHLPYCNVTSEIKSGVPFEEVLKKRNKLIM